MKKKILSLALAAITITGFTSFAQTTDNNTVKKEQVSDKAAKRGRDFKKGAMAPNPFEGLNLTESQQEQLKALREKRVADRKAKFEAMKQQKAADDQKRIDRKNFNDSTRMAEMRADKKKYLEEVKAIIGPDNYVIFLENFYVNNQGMPKGRPGKDFRHGDRSKRPDFNGAKLSKNDRKAAKADRKVAKADRKAARQAKKMEKAAVKG